MIGVINFFISFAIMASIYAIFSMALNIHWGYTGLLNFGIAGFFAIGAFTSALVTSAMPTGDAAAFIKQAIGLNAPFLVGVIAAAIVSGIIAALVGMLTLRISEGYLAICTIGISESIRLFFNNERWLANGAQGLIGLKKPLADIIPPGLYNYFYLFIVLLFLLAIYLAIEVGIRSPWGRVLKAIREDEVMTGANGKNVFFFKLQAFIFGGIIMGIGGALYAHSSGAIQPGTFEPLFGTFIIWAMLTLGGTGNNRGAILGAFIVWGLWSLSNIVILNFVPVWFQTKAPYIRYILIGLILIIILLKRPKGIMGAEKQVSKL
jgi:branched-chain amino acid transport system permease protein